MSRTPNVLLTREECAQILEKSSANEPVQLLDFQLESDSSAVGYLGDYYALTLSYCRASTETAQSKQLFVKALPQQSEELEKEAIFRKEAWLYDNLLTEMQTYSNIKWSAKCFFTRSDLCVLEDIKLLGYQAAPERLLSEPQLHQLLRTMAAFHASSLIYEQRKDLDIGLKCGSHLQEITVASNIAWFTTGVSAVRAVIRSLPRYQGDHQVDLLLEKLIQRVYEQVAPSKKYRNVLCHRDLWAGNIFFPVDERDPALLVDYQTCRYSPPAIDLCFCLYLNLTAKERRRLEASCIDFYYDWLQQDLKHFGLPPDSISKDELLKSYEEFRLFAIVYTAVAATVVKVPPSFITNEFKYVDRSAVILDYIQESPKFREDMEMCCVEVMEIASSNL